MHKNLDLRHVGPLTDLLRGVLSSEGEVVMTAPDRVVRWKGMYFGVYDSDEMLTGPYESLAVLIRQDGAEAFNGSWAGHALHVGQSRTVVQGRTRCALFVDDQEPRFFKDVSAAILDGEDRLWVTGAPLEITCTEQVESSLKGLLSWHPEVDPDPSFVVMVNGERMEVMGLPARRSAVTVNQPTRATPRLIAHADWGTNPKKRWMCLADRSDEGRFHVGVPELVGNASALLGRLDQRAGRGGALAGFDFPIGVPASYAERAGISDFKSWLLQLGRGAWDRFYDAAESAAEISITRPFYPHRPGGTKQQHLTDALGVHSMKELLRACERAGEGRGAASPLFWTLGGKQVGKAALLGWREVLVPALRDPELDVALWPFDGELGELLRTARVVVVETYPAEACLHLGMTPPGRGWAKTRQEGRRSQSEKLLAWAADRPVELAAELVSMIEDGFGPTKDAEDPFDAVLGLCSMIEVVLGGRPAGAPDRTEVRTVEGWILGQEAGR